MTQTPSALQELIRQFEQLPGVGPKTAERFALFIVKKPAHIVRGLADAIYKAQEALILCKNCFNITENSPSRLCAICAHPERDKQTICVVADSADIIAIEKAAEYRGIYHVLGGLIHPLRGINPEHLRIQELEDRIHAKKPKEIILALNCDADGETTMMYLAKLFHTYNTYNLKITRLARGLPTGSNVEYADERTIANALLDRKLIA